MLVFNTAGLTLYRQQPLINVLCRLYQSTVHEQRLSSVDETSSLLRRCCVGLATLIQGRFQHRDIDQSALRRVPSQYRQC